MQMEYRYLSMLGEGSNSIVYRAEKDGIVYAIKRVPIQYILSEMIGMIISDSISSTHIMRPYRYIIDDDYIYTVMNLEQGNIRMLIDNMTEDIAYILMEQILTSVGYLHHNGITHNLLIESNILVSGLSVSISDFNNAGYGYSTDMDLYDLGMLMKKMYKDTFSTQYIDVMNALIDGTPIKDVLHMKWFSDYIYRIPDNIYKKDVAGSTYASKLYHLSGNRDEYIPIIRMISNALENHIYVDTVLTDMDNVHVVLSFLDTIDYTLLI